MTSLISINQFREDARAKRKLTGGVYRLSTDPALEVEGKERTLRFCFSDGSVDRMGDTISASGWDLTDFLRNPVSLWSHDSSAPPIGRASNVGVESGRLMGDITFAPIETYAFADTVYRLVLGKYVNAVSVGFIPTRYSFVENDPDRGFGIDFQEQTLLEISLCPIPANPNALIDARSKGINLGPLVEWAERILDSGGVELKRTLISRDELQKLRKAAKDPAMTIKRAPRRRADEDDDDDKKPVEAKCGRKADDECGMTDPTECSIHGKNRAADDDEEKRVRRILAKILGPKFKADDDDDRRDDDPPLAHEDSIRLAHKSLRTSKAFLAEAVSHHTKAMSLLDDVVDALDETPDNADDDEKSEGDDDKDPPDEDPDGEKAARMKRAAERRRRISAV